MERPGTDAASNSWVPDNIGIITLPAYSPELLVRLLLSRQPPHPDYRLGRLKRIENPRHVHVS